MRFFHIIASGAALIASALAQSTVIQINDYPQDGVVAGQQYTITYSPADNTPTTFILRKGPSGDLGTIGTLTTSATGGSFTWKVASDLVDGDDYALEIRRGDEVNYSAQFGLTGGSGSASSAVSSTSSAVSSAASSASSAASYSASSVSSRISSASSSVITSQSSLITSASSAVSGAIVSTSSRNGTVSTSKPTATSSSSIPESTGAAASLASSPLALVFGAVAAMMFLN